MAVEEKAQESGQSKDQRFPKLRPRYEMPKAERKALRPTEDFNPGSSIILAPPHRTSSRLQVLFFSRVRANTLVISRRKTIYSNPKDPSNTGPASTLAFRSAWLYFTSLERWVAQNIDCPHYGVRVLRTSVFTTKRRSLSQGLRLPFHP